MRLTGTVEILPDRLYFSSIHARVNLERLQQEVANEWPDAPEPIFFTVDRVLVYEPFCKDFGPLNLGKFHRFSQILSTKLDSPTNTGRRIFFYTAHGHKKRSNAAFLIGAYGVAVLGQSPALLAQKLSYKQKPYIGFRDALSGDSVYRTTVEMCLQAMYQAIKNGFYDPDDFDISSYEHYEMIENGDLTVIVPDKFIHLCGPSDTKTDIDGYPTLSPQDYLEVFENLGVTDVVRLNSPRYDPKTFTDKSMHHHDMYFTDGSTPSMEIILDFIAMCEDALGAIAVHCKAGLGRTGTCVGAYMMKHYRMTAHEVIAWIRICRPGSVLGPQQAFLVDIQDRMWQMGDVMRNPSSPSKQLHMGMFDADIDVSEMSVDDGDDRDSDGDIFVPIAKHTIVTRSSTNGSRNKNSINEINVSQGDLLRRQKMEAQHHNHHRN